jgi:hypothetical protein
MHDATINDPGTAQRRLDMSDEVRNVSYGYILVPDKPGEGARILSSLKSAGVNLLAYSGFPAGRGKAQIDLVSEDMAAVKQVAKANKWKMSPVKKGFLVQGDDRVGAVSDTIRRLADAKINVTAADGVSAGGGRWGMILWVAPRAHAKAAKVLAATGSPREESPVTM